MLGHSQVIGDDKDYCQMLYTALNSKVDTLSQKRTIVNTAVRIDKINKIFEHLMIHVHCIHTLSFIEKVKRKYLPQHV